MGLGPAILCLIFILGQVSGEANMTLPEQPVQWSQIARSWFNIGREDDFQDDVSNTTYGKQEDFLEKYTVEKMTTCKKGEKHHRCKK